MSIVLLLYVKQTFQSKSARGKVPADASVFRLL